MKWVLLGDALPQRLIALLQQRDEVEKAGCRSLCDQQTLTQVRFHIQIGGDGIGKFDGVFGDVDSRGITAGERCQVLYQVHVFFVDLRDQVRATLALYFDQKAHPAHHMGYPLDDLFDLEPPLALGHDVHPPLVQYLRA
ncbi:uncharacterized protein METZ01_LOCUS60613 [marine metagenome]|uniref:Uncharacterized protein n=1 Tax=marine metagenome TaxID=408172 RepID=A0A381SWC4_9ZZZZ